MTGAGLVRLRGDWARDLQYGARALLHTPRFTLVSLLTIVLLVGGITTIFTLVNGVLLRPLPYPDADRLVIVESVQRNQPGTTVELRDVQFLESHGRTLDRWGLYRAGYVENIQRTSGEPLEVHDLLVTPDLFPMLALDVAMGRPLLPSDVSSAAGNVLVISHELWQTLFNRDPNVVGRSVTLRWGTFTVVGVTGPSANVPTNWLTMPIMWRPVREDTDPETRLTTLAHLRRGASLDEGRTELAVLAARLAADRPDTHKDRTASVTLLLDEIVGDFKRVLWIFFSAVTLVALIGIGNLISLQLARNGAREREVAVRAALGASRGRILRQLVLESFLLCGFGGALGLAMAWPVVRLIASTLPPRFPRADQIVIDVTVSLFAWGIALLVGALTGALPAWQASRVDLSTRLHEGGRMATAGRSRSRTQRTLIAVQTAVAFMLVVGAGLLANSFYRLISRDAGMQEEGLWVVRGTLPSKYREDAAKNAFWTSALEQVRALGGVESAAIVMNSSGPLTGNDISTRAAREGVAVTRDSLRVSYRRVSDRYFQTLGTPILKGRPILDSDAAGAESVVVINELLASRLWPGEDPIGKRLQSRGIKTVVGVIPTFRHSRLDGEPAPQMFIPYWQEPGAATTSAIMVRTRAGDRGTSSAVAAGLTRLEKDLQVTVSSMDAVRWKLLATERFRVAVLLAFAGSALFLALVGIAGLVAYTVGQRQREIAVRVALGAVGRDVLRVASDHAVVPAFAGLALGVAGAVMATRLLASFLVDIQPFDLPTFAATLGVLAVSVLVAAVIPARQALTIDPVEALRSE